MGIFVLGILGSLGVLGIFVDGFSLMRPPALGVRLGAVWRLGHIWRSEWLGGDTPFEPEERSQRWENAARYVL